MKFCIISHVPHSVQGTSYYAYGPYVREINSWLQPGMELIVVAPLVADQKPGAIDLSYSVEKIRFVDVAQFNFTSVAELAKALKVVPGIVRSIYKAMQQADHIHLRCPGNMGLLGALVQVLFPRKKKTAKYAGNWDWNSHQPRSYRFQQRLLRNTFLTRNMKVLVYGEWPDRTRNILPFFTASYSENDKTEVNKPAIATEVKLAFVGTLTGNKSPETALQVLRILTAKGISARLSYCGEGPERAQLESLAQAWDLQERTEIPGNVSADRVKEVVKSAHFLVFISRSEGWPKAVAEAMWWGCVPITTAVSCVPQMLGKGDDRVENEEPIHINGISSKRERKYPSTGHRQTHTTTISSKRERGYLVENDAVEIARIIEENMHRPGQFATLSNAAMEWSRGYTLEKFRNEVQRLLH